MLRVAFTDRVIKHHVGGNSTYTKRLIECLPQHGVMPITISGPLHSPNPLAKAVYATWEGLLSPSAAPQRTDVLHYTADTGGLRQPSLPTVSTIHGIASLHISGVRNRPAEALWRARVRRLAALSDAVITVSESSAADLQDFLDIDPDRIHVIPHGVDHSRFHNCTEDQDERILTNYALPDRFALYLGNLDPRKNVLALVEAFEASGLGEELPLVIAGAPAWGYQHILERLETAQYVKYIGKVEDRAVAPLMRASTLFVFPSLYEGFGLPVLEAMACGTPVACSDRGSLREVAGDAALLLHELSGEAIADSLLTLIRDHAALTQYSQAGLKHASKFTWNTSAARHAQVYMSLLDGGL